MGKKKQFIDRTEAAHFHLVHRSQRDPKVADPEAPQRVLQPVERRGTSERASQSTRAWLEEQDLGGFEEAEPSVAAGNSTEANSDLGMPEDGYNYAQHMRAIDESRFVAAVPSVASQTRSAVSSQMSRLSMRSRAQSFVLRGMPSEAFETPEELELGAGGAYNDMNAVQEEEDGAYLEDEMDEDLWAALHDEEEEDNSAGEIDDDFVMQAERETELVLDPVRPKKRRGERDVETLLEDVVEQADEVDHEGDAGKVDASVHKVEGGLAALMGWSDDDDDEDGGDDDSASAPVAAAKLRKDWREGKVRDPDRQLDAQFARLMTEYDDEEIGELDEFDPAVQGETELDAFDAVMDGFLQDQRDRFVQIGGMMESGSSREHARIYPDKRAAAIDPPTGDGAATGKAGEAAGQVGADDSDSDSDGSIEDHPFFDGLKEKPKEEQWDAETILTTYTTTDNHPHMLRVKRRPKHECIELDRRTGLPVGIMLPAEEERLKRQEQENKTDDLDEDDDGEDYGGGAPGVNLGAPRPRKESAEEKRQRKLAAKGEKASRRAEKKGTKLAFAAERVKQVDVKLATTQLPGTSLSH